MIKNLSEDQKFLDVLLENREWQSFECKRANIKPAKLLETVVAFLNTNGGTIVVGIEDPDKALRDARLFGVSENSDNISELMSLLDKELVPPMAIEVLALPIKNISKKNDQLILLRIPKSNDVHSLKNGDTYVRNGRQNTKIGSSEIIRLKYEKGSIKFESEPSQISTLEELDGPILKRFQSDIGSATDDIWQCLKDNGMAKEYPDKMYLTKGGALVFARNPSVSLGSKSGIKISHYYGVAQNYTGEPNFVRRPFTIEGPLLIQIEKTMDYFREAVKNSPPKLIGAEFRPSLMIPEWAFQEAITNAVIHRNYSVEDDIQLRIFDDRIEVESPGTYPGHITPLNIRKERFARNPLVLRALNKFSSSPNLDIGEGVDRMFQVMRDNNLYEPLYIPPAIRPNSVLVMLLNMQKIEYWDVVSNYLDKEFVITNGAARKITGIGDSVKMSRLLKSWVDNGVLEIITQGSKRHTFYKKVGIDLPSKLLASFSN